MRRWLSAVDVLDIFISQEKKIHILAYAPTDILQPHPPMTLQRLCLDTVHGYDVLATLTVIEGRR